MIKKSILIDSKAHAELTKLTESLNINFGTLVAEMIYYFKKTGIDPKDAVNKNPSIMVAALDKRIVSFMKVQERDILKPLRQDVFNYQNLQKEEISKLNNSFTKLVNQHSERVTKIENFYTIHLNKINNNDLARTKFINVELEKNRQLVTEVKNSYVNIMNTISKYDADRTNKINSELEKNRQAITLLCQLVDDKNKSGTMDKIKGIFS